MASRAGCSTGGRIVVGLDSAVDHTDYATRSLEDLRVMGREDERDAPVEKRLEHALPGQLFTVALDGQDKIIAMTLDGHILGRDAFAKPQDIDII